MALSQAYLEWEQQTKQRGIEQGIERGVERGFKQGVERVVTNILSARFGAIDEELESILPAILELPIEDSTPLLLQLTRQELIQRFTR
jgi:flagellar biosynthesis/type III secretory pathway protein FliH